MRKSVLLFVLCALLLTLPAVAAAEGMAWRELPVVAQVQWDGKLGGTESLQLQLRAGQTVQVDLMAAAGTGYLWSTPITADLKYAILAHDSGPQALTERAGGPLQQRLFYQARGGVEGTETLTFVLRRPWEAADKVAATRTLTISVKP
ncbi:protease inhibitor I42 family protein [Anaeroarcus burkinensis]|uniref:protease inhibitor I42 family protein n=1 Tax=Anaeroarcus burkinensis TaxID=82376 RepID=UPI0004243A7D|nr:protease inhibitor I42 family protein [Anaeroarcus burkinensis]